jgi:hypothetical protein
MRVTDRLAGQLVALGLIGAGLIVFSIVQYLWK